MPPRPIPNFEMIDEEMAAVLRQKTGAERLEIAFGMIRSARTMLECHFRIQHPSGTRTGSGRKPRSGLPVETSELIR